MRTVTLEFLRHGPSQGHLLSPLARYMALCGNYQPADLSVPFDHAELIARLRPLLNTIDSAETRELQLAETARAIGSVLGCVPGLIGELKPLGGEETSPIHLRIISNANELALLPFELATAPSAFPGAGQFLALQTQVPLCITRETRNVGVAVKWANPPRILFAAAAPSSDVPAAEHLKALEAVIEPWMLPYKEELNSGRSQRVAEHLTYLPKATAEELMETCATGSYTHVHLLAHGLITNNSEGRRYGLALHSGSDLSETDQIDADRLAAIICPQIKGRLNTTARPAVVTLAACHSGSQGSVIGAGASIAHALHHAGIPLVVASQFPITFPGSVLLTRILYEGLLHGADPRELLIDVRRQLKVQLPGRQDWASVIAYASFPPDLDQQLAKTQVAQGARSIDAAVAHADQATQTLAHETGEAVTGNRTRLLHSANQRLRSAMVRMECALSTEQADKAVIHGLLGRAYKRKADVFWEARSDDATFGPEAIQALELSREEYEICFETDRSQTWAAVQALVLTLTVGGAAELSRKLDMMNLARLLSIRDMDSDDRQRRAWAFGNALELELLANCTDRPLAGVLPSWEDCVDRLRASLGAGSAEVRSTRRQLARWRMFREVRSETANHQEEVVEKDWDRLSELAEAMHRRLPLPISVGAAR